MSTETLIRETQLADSPHSMSPVPYQRVPLSAVVGGTTWRQRFLSNIRYFGSLIGCGLCSVAFTGILCAMIQMRDRILPGVTYLWCAIALAIPLFWAVRLMYSFVQASRPVTSSDPNAAMICSVEVCINNETVLTVRSWWPLRMPRAEVERHGVRVGMSSARRWLTENSQPGGKITRIRFDEEIATGLCQEYICESKDAGCNQCSVCLDDIESNGGISMRKCGHCFHQDCLSSWFSQSRRLVCPMC